MAGFFQKLKQTLLGPTRVTVRSAGSSTPSRRANSGRHVVVQADDRPLWEIKGWKRDGDRLRGAYRLAGLRSFAGEIDISDSRRPLFFITSPPPRSIFEGRHAGCFRKRGKGRYYIHLGISNPTIDSGLVAVEKLLAQAVREG